MTASRQTIPGLVAEAAERFADRLAVEDGEVEIFFSLEDARRKLERWRIDYNRDRPHSSIGNLAPIEFDRKSSTCDRYSFQGQVTRGRARIGAGSINRGRSGQCGPLVLVGV
jgi:hypothetical protein